MKEKGTNRRQRAYKVKDEFYDKAMLRAKKEGGTIANLVENVLIAYSFGLEIKAVKSYAGGGRAIDVFTTDGALSIMDFCKKANKK